MMLKRVVVLEPAFSWKCHACAALNFALADASGESCGTDLVKCRACGEEFGVWYAGEDQDE